ncbi:MAG: patatin-like phospholipase family protein [Steroidobacteraceae bacterium]
MKLAVSSSAREPAPKVGLVLTGGGARAAYQVGVLKAVAELLPQRPNPFRVIVGTSAGAVAASAIAARARRWQRAVEQIEHVWGNFHVDQVFYVGMRRMVRSGLHWLAALASAGRLVSPPSALFDNAPLHQLLSHSVNWRGIRRNIARGDLDALGLCATSYGTALSTTFFAGNARLHEWTRYQHVGRRTELTLAHLMASAAVPFLFPPVLLTNEYFGDGAMRQLSPLSPAIHLGANRLLVIGVRAPDKAGVMPVRARPECPTPGQLFGYMLDTLFMDQIYGDLEQLERMNRIVSEAPHVAPNAVKVSTLLITPSEDPRRYAERHMLSPPRSLRSLFRVVGAGDAHGSQLSSYLMFEADYTRDLINLGYRDAMQRSAELVAFLTGEEIESTISARAIQ